MWSCPWGLLQRPQAHVCQEQLFFYGIQLGLQYLLLPQELLLSLHFGSKGQLGGDVRVGRNLLPQRLGRPAVTIAVQRGLTHVKVTGRRATNATAASNKSRTRLNPFRSGSSVRPAACRQKASAACESL
jgi:hypothetical protein